MGFFEDLNAGLQTATETVQNVGEFAGAVKSATNPQSGQGLAGYGASGPAQIATSIQNKLDTNQTLTSSDLANKKELEAQGYSFSYPLTGYSTDTGAVSGIQQASLVGDLATSLGLSAASAAGTALATQAATAAASPGGLPVPWWKGPGGALQAPWNDPRIPQFLQQFALDDAYLKNYVRAPRGYVVIRDANGRPYAVLRQIARQFGLWHAAPKPPISASDWRHYKRNQALEKKLLKIARPALRHHSRPSTTKKGRK